MNEVYLCAQELILTGLQISPMVKLEVVVSAFTSLNEEEVKRFFTTDTFELLIEYESVSPRRQGHKAFGVPQYFWKEICGGQHKLQHI